MATCGFCKDMFSVVMVDRRGELSIEPSRTVQTVEGQLIHRPGQCGGRVHLIGQDRLAVA